MNINTYGKKETIFRILALLIAALFLMLAFAMPAFADGPEYGQNIGSWITDQAFWVGLAVVVLVLIPMVMRKAWVPVATTIVLAAIVLFVIKNPQALVSVGEKLFSILE